MSHPSTPNQADPANTPWWKVGTMWLVVGFPLAAIIASGITIWLAIHSPDPAASAPIAEGALQPALQARNRVGDTRPAPPAPESKD